jgi:hypothetical protein
MLELFSHGNKVGLLPGAEKILEYASRHESLEIRDSTGKLVGRFVPDDPLCPWDPSLTEEKIDEMIRKGGGMSLTEFWSRMGVE